MLIHLNYEMAFSGIQNEKVKHFSYETMDEEVHAFLRITQPKQLCDEAFKFTSICLDENRYEYHWIMLRLNINLKLHRHCHETIKFTLSFDRSVVSSR